MYCRGCPPLVLLFVLAFFPRAVIGAGVPRTKCFPVEGLSAMDRATAQALLQQAMDSDALFTIIPGVCAKKRGSIVRP